MPCLAALVIVCVWLLFLLDQVYLRDLGKPTQYYLFLLNLIYLLLLIYIGSIVT